MKIENVLVNEPVRSIIEGETLKAVKETIEKTVEKEEVQDDFEQVQHKIDFLA